MATRCAPEHVSVHLIKVSEIGRGVDVGLAHARSHEVAHGTEARDVVAVFDEFHEVFEGVRELRLHQL